ncbi:unnamed protein product, partial [Effrenium voratum]
HRLGSPKRANNLFSVLAVGMAAALPKLSREDLQRYSEVISRAGELLSLASLVPVVLRGRVAFAKARTRDNEPAESSTSSTSSTSSRAVRVPCGAWCLVLLLVSEVVGSRAWLVEPQKLAKTVKQVTKSISSRNDLVQLSLLQRVAFVLAEFLSSSEVFFAAHRAVMVCILLGVLLTYFVNNLLAAFGKRKGFDLRLLTFLVPVAVVVAGHHASLKLKIADAGSNLLPALQIFLQAHALLTLPSSEDVPPGFAVLQASSLLAKILAEVASGSFTEAILAVRSGQLKDNRVFWQCAPQLVAVLGLCPHLARSMLLMTAVALLSLITCPVTLALLWPKLATAFGLTGAPELALTRLLSVGYGLMAGGSLISGGTLGMVSVMLVVQVLTQIHGTEVFAKMIS